MFVQVTVLKPHSHDGKRQQVDETPFYRKGDAKILQAIGKVKIIPNTERPTKTLAAPTNFVLETKISAAEKAKAETEAMAKIEAETQAKESEALGTEDFKPEEKPAEPEKIAEEEQPAEPVKSEPKTSAPAKGKQDAKKGKYQTRVMTAK